jgi:hypothetical protein
LLTLIHPAMPDQRGAVGRSRAWAAERLHPGNLNPPASTGKVFQPHGGTNF